LYRAKEERRNKESQGMIALDFLHFYQPIRKYQLLHKITFVLHCQAQRHLQAETLLFQRRKMMKGQVAKRSPGGNGWQEKISMWATCQILKAEILFGYDN
jgi:hypothetical protein